MTKSYKLIKEEFDHAMSKLEERSPWARGGSIGYGSEEQQKKFAEERRLRSLSGMQLTIENILWTVNRPDYLAMYLKNEDSIYFQGFKDAHNKIALIRQGLGRYYKGTGFKKQEVSRELGTLIEKSRSLIEKAIKMFPTIFKKYSSEYNREAGGGLPEIKLPDGEFYTIAPLPVGPKKFKGYKGEKEMMNKKRFASQRQAFAGKVEAFDQLLINIEDALEAIKQQRKRDENPQQQAEPSAEPQAAAEPAEEPQQQAKPTAKPAGGQSLADRLKGLEVK
jgi:hypothetical protein